MITTRLAGEFAAQRLVAEMRRGYPQGFVAYLQGDIRPRLKQLTHYLAKYVVSPPMALSRIIAYDRVRGTVTYWYRDHQRGGNGAKRRLVGRRSSGGWCSIFCPKGSSASAIMAYKRLVS